MSLLTNLIAYWRLDESSGNATDSVSGNILTNNNTVTFTAGLINNGANFGSPNTNKSLSTSATLGIDGGAVSLSCWVKLNSEISSGIYGIIENSISSGTKTAYYIHYQFNGGTRRLNFSRAKQNVIDQNVVSNITLGTSTWNHVVLTYDTTTLTAYINGSSVGTALASGSGSGTATGGTFLGEDATSGGGPFFGAVIIDEVGIWSRALSSGEVTSLYNGGSGFQYPFNGGGGLLVFF